MVEGSLGGLARYIFQGTNKSIVCTTYSDSAPLISNLGPPTDLEQQHLISKCADDSPNPSDHKVFKLTAH